MYVKFNTFDKILIQNEDPNFVYIIKKGKVKVYSLTPTGIKYLERTYCENDLFGELEVFANKPILNYVEALEPCEGIKISKESFLEWIKYDSEFSLIFIQSFLKRCIILLLIAKQMLLII